MAKDKTINITGNTTEAQATIGDLKRFAKKEFDKMSKDADKSSKEVSAAYKKMGIRTDAAIRESSENARKEFARIKNSGTASANEIRRAHARMTAKIKSNNAEMAAGAGKVTKVMGLLKSKLIGLALAVGVVKLFKDMTASALENEVQVRKLRTQVDNLNISYDENADAIDRAVNATAKYATVQSGDVSQVLQQLLFVTGDLTKSMESLNLIYDLAHLKGIDVKTSTELVGRALSGNVETLGRYFVEFKNLNETLGKNATLQDKAAFAVAFLNEKVAGSIKDMTRHQFAVRFVKNEWSSFVQLAGEKIFAALDFIFKGILKISIAWKKGQKALVFVTGLYAKFYEKLGLVKNVTGFLSDKTKRLNKDIDGLKDKLKRASGEADKLENAEKRLAKSSKDVATEIKERSDALDEEKGKALKLLKDENEQIEKNKETAIDALKTRETAQKTLNATIKTAIQATREELRKLKKDVEDAQDFLNTIDGKIKQSLRDVAQRGFTPAEKLISDQEFGEQDFKKAQKERDKGNFESARKLALSALDKQLNVIGADKVGLQVSGISTAGLDKAAERAERVQNAIERFGQEMEGAAQAKVPAVSEELETLEGQLKAGEATLAGIKQGMKDANTEAQALKEKLSEDTTATHTTIFKEVHGNSGAGNAPSSEAKNADVDTALKKQKLLNKERNKDTAATHTETTKFVGPPTINDIVNQGGTRSFNSIQEAEEFKKAFRRFNPGLKFKTGGGIDGYGGGDKVPALLEAGEHVIKKESVRKIGRAAAEAFNRGDINGLIANLLNAQNVQRFAQGGPVKDVGKFSVDLNVGGKTFNMTTSKKTGESFMNTVKKANIIYGKSKRQY